MSAVSNYPGVKLSSYLVMCECTLCMLDSWVRRPEGREGQSQKAPRLLANHNFHHELHQDGDFCLDLHRTDGAVLEELCQEIGYTPQLFEATDLKGRNYVNFFCF